MYLAVTQGTAEWLHGKQGLTGVLFDSLIADESAIPSLRGVEFVEGPFRIASTPDQELIAIWNIDYLSGTGEEPWGFIKLDGEHSVRAEPTIGKGVLERCLYVINQRLQGLRIEGAYIHRSYANGSHTCLAGRGSQARQFSIGFFERVIGHEKSSNNSVICIGPSYDPNFRILSNAAAREGRRLEEFVTRANRLVGPARNRTVADQSVLASVRSYLVPFAKDATYDDYADIQIETSPISLGAIDAFRSYGWTYDQWVRQGSPLSDVQRRVLLADPLDRHPLRIVGPGGSGKTLLMQLLAVRVMRTAIEENRDARILYVVHNSAMQEKVSQRFQVLQGPQRLDDGAHRVLDIQTLLEYGRTALGLEFSSVIDPDGHEAKLFQLEQITLAMRDEFVANETEWNKSGFLRAVMRRPELEDVFARLLMAEISSAVKGHGLEGDRRRYIQAETPLSRLHGAVGGLEREFIFSVFERYHRAVFLDYEVLDTDDIAVSLLGRLKTPVWELKRKTIGYDFVFVDETQLFNENERRVLPLLTKGNTSHVPIALALDEAQELYGQRSAGLSTLGIKDIANESLASIHRSTKSIVQLAFHIIQRSTDLFGADFPDFTGIADRMEPDRHPLASKPSFLYTAGRGIGMARAVVDFVGGLREKNYRQVAIICHAEQYWNDLKDVLEKSRLPFQTLVKRGERLSPDQPLVVLTRPAHVGGQEFDAVVLVGLEQGIVPTKITGNDALSSAVEQQALREMYLAVTRSRFRVTVVVSAGNSPTPVLQDAQKQGFIV